MFELQKAGFLDKIDAISSVSGGSITAAYYCLSYDPGQDDGSGPVSGPTTVTNLLTHNYVTGSRGIVVNGYIERPYNILLVYWLSIGRLAREKWPLEGITYGQPCKV
jgi:hypothetical protein